MTTAIPAPAPTSILMAVLCWSVVVSEARVGETFHMAVLGWSVVVGVACPLSVFVSDVPGQVDDYLSNYIIINSFT